MNIEKDKLFLKLIENGHLLNLSMVRGILALPVNNRFVHIDDKEYLIEIDETLYVCKTDTTKPLININEEIILPKGCMSIVKSDIKTTYGRALVNYLLLEYGLEGLIPYRNEMFTYKDIEKEVIIPALLDKRISSKIFKRCVNVDIFIRSLSDLVVIAVSEKMVFAPEDLNKVKSKIKKRYDDEYGSDWISDKELVLKFEDEISEYYKEYLKDDPTLGITLDNKMFKSIKSRMIAVGILDTLDKSGNNKAVIESLYEGISNDPDKIAAIFNSVIFGSSARGSLTAVGGVISKSLTRATHAYKIEDIDCGVDYGANIVVDDTLIGRSLVNGTKLTIDNIKNYIGKSVEMRSLIYCKSKGERFCKVCAGDSLSRLDNSILLVALSIGGAILKHYLSKFHTTNRRVIKIEKDMMF